MSSGKRMRPKRPARPVIAVPWSENRKTGPVGATYASQKTCPKSCPLRHKGCYAETGPMGMITKRLNDSAKGLSVRELAVAEADLIDRLPAFSPLRLHVVGDCATDEAARIVAGAAERYMTRGTAADVWTYTHAWRDVERDSWGGVSVLASCHGVAEAGEAMDRGYAASVIVDEFPDGGRPWVASDATGEEVTLVPCKFQVDRTPCHACKVCFRDDRLHATRTAVAFAAHGSRRGSVVKTLL